MKGYFLCNDGVTKLLLYKDIILVHRPNRTSTLDFLSEKLTNVVA